MSDGTAVRSFDELQVRLLRHLLSVQFRGVEELRRQLDVAKISKNWGETSASFDIVVPSDVPQASLADGPAPIEALVEDERGEYLGELILWISQGTISALEYAWVTDMPPVKLPDVGEISVAPA